MNTKTLWALLRFLFTAMFLYAIWLLFTSDMSLFSLIAGGIGSILVSAITFTIFIPEHQAHIKYFLPHPVYLVLYMIIMVKNLYVSSFIMLKAIFTRSESLRIVHFKTRLKSDLARMVLANSITFTPGTITLDLNDDHLVVHWFFCSTRHMNAAGEAIKGKIEKHIGRIWL